MAAFMRLSHFSRAFVPLVLRTGQKSIKTRSFGYCIHSQLSDILICPFHKPVRYIGRTFSTHVVKKNKDAPVTFPPNYPASEYWKKFDFCGREILSSDFDECCKIIDSRTNTKQGYSAIEFHYFMKLMEENDALTADTALIALKSCGVTCKQLTNAERIAWTDYLLNKFTLLGVPLTAMHYKSVLSNYHFCDHEYSPTEFVSQMKEQDIAPDRVILGRFIQRYCKVGDMYSASKILEHMKLAKMAISLTVYNSLIMGHFIAGNPEIAMRLFNDTRNIGFELTQSTYHAAIIGQAYRNDMKAFKELFVQAQEENITFTDAAYSSLIEKVAEKGLTEYFDHLLSLLKEQSTYYYNEAQDTLKVLMTQGNYEIAYRYFEGLTDPSAQIFYRAAISINLPVEEIVKYSRLMKKQGYRLSALADSLASAFRLFEYDRGAAILPYLEKEGEKMRPQYLWPFICNYRATNDLEGLKRILPFCFADRMTVEEFLNPTLIELGVSLEDYSQLIKDHCTKFTVEERNTCELHMILHTQGPQAALDAVDRFDTLSSLGQYDDSIMLFLRVLNKYMMNWRTVLLLMMAVSRKTNENLLSLVYGIAKHMTASGQPLDELKDCLLELGYKSTEYHLRNIGLLDLLTEEEFERLVVKGRFHTFDEIQGMTTEDILKIKIRNSFVTVLLLKRLWYEKNISVFEKVLADVDFRVLKSKELLAYMKTLNDNVTNRNRSLECHLVYNTSTELAKLGHHKDARNVLAILKEDVTNQTYDEMRPCHFFEDDQLTTEQAHHLFEELHGYGGKIANSCYKYDILFAYTTFIAKRCNFDEIKELLEMLNTKYNLEGKLNPMALFSPIIKQDNKELLQKVFNLLRKKHVEKRLLLTLAASFVEEDKMDQARKALNIPGLTADVFVLETFICDTWVKQNKTDVLMKFYSIIKDFKMVDRKNVLFRIFKSLCIRRDGSPVDVDACIEFFETGFGEEGVGVNRHMLRYYAKFLTTHGRKVHFTVDDENIETVAPRTTRETEYDWTKKSQLLDKLLISERKKLPKEEEDQSTDIIDRS